MPAALATALCVIAAFAVGTIPWGLLLARRVAGVDVRTVGSGNVGATNVSRVLGRRWFLVVFALDAAKGALPVLVAPRLLGADSSAWTGVACGLAAVLGHVFNPFLRWKGGKGVATAAGVCGALAPVPALCALGVFLAVLAAARFVSLASICGAASLPPFALVLGSPTPVVVFGVVAAAVVTLRHRANLGRIAAGTEPRVFAKKETVSG
jgi:glycerol-3-phosphate acyltransferase PlsY